MNIPNGAFTALVTPFTKDGTEVDFRALELLVRFQVFQGVSGIVPVGTTGESPTLTETEHDTVNYEVLRMVGTTAFVIAGCGSNSTKEAIHYVGEAVSAGAKAVLLVDPYYNGPSSLEIRHEYYAVIAKMFPDVIIIPYIIPGRTGCGLLPEDLVSLAREFPNICAVKEATGNLERMAYTRSLAPNGFQILSGDDDKTFEMMTKEDIKASGVISVVSNIAPAAVQEMWHAVWTNNIPAAVALRDKLDPLFKIVTVFADRRTLYGNDVKDKVRNPLPVKTAMRILGMPVGPCRQPLGKMTVAGFEQVLQALRKVWINNPEILRPIEPFFNVNIAERLGDKALHESLTY